MTWSQFTRWFAETKDSLPAAVRRSIASDAKTRHYARMAGDRSAPDGYADLFHRGENAIGGK